MASNPLSTPEKWGSDPNSGRGLFGDPQSGYEIGLRPRFLGSGAGQSPHAQACSRRVHAIGVGAKFRMGTPPADSNRVLNFDPTPIACCVAEGFSHCVFDSCLSSIDLGEWLFWLQIRSARQKNGVGSRFRTRSIRRPSQRIRNRALTPIFGFRRGTKPVRTGLQSPGTRNRGRSKISYRYLARRFKPRPEF